MLARMPTPIPTGYATRPARDGDLDGVVRMVDQADRALGVLPDPVREFLAWVWNIPSTDLARDTRIVLEGDDVIAFGQARWKPDEGGPLDLFVRVHPEHVGSGIGSWCLSWGEALSAERGTEGIGAEVVDVDRPAHDLLRSRGYRQVRSSFTMWKVLDSDEDTGAVPGDVTIRPFGSDADARVLYDVHEASFADHWGFRPSSFARFSEELFGHDWDPSLAFLAEAEGEAVGFVVAFAFEAEGYVGLLGVVTPWRGRGIGKALMRRAFAELANRGKREVLLSVDAQSTHGAVGLYESVGMSVRRRYDRFDRGTPDAGGPWT